MVDVSRSGSDPSAGLPGADQATVREIQGEQNQATRTVVQQAVSVVTGIFNPSAEAAQQARTAAGMGQGFQFTPEEIETQLTQCQTLATDYRNDRTDIEIMMRTQPPSPDPASTAHAQTIRKFGTDLRKRNQSQAQFLQDWMNKLNQAKQAYLQSEHVTEAEWSRMARGLSA